MKACLRLLLCICLLFLAKDLRAQDDDKPKDAEGCKDSPLITRFPGSIINSCENKEFEQADFPLGSDKDGNALVPGVILALDGKSSGRPSRLPITQPKTAARKIAASNSPNNNFSFFFLDVLNRITPSFYSAI
jgi:hypothetical protein